MNDTRQEYAAEIQRRILDYIRDELLDEEIELRPDDDLLSGELLYSVAVLRLATFVDETYGIGMKPSDFTVENFQTVSALTDYVLRAKAASDSID